MATDKPIEEVDASDVSASFILIKAAPFSWQVSPNTPKGEFIWPVPAAARNLLKTSPHAALRGAFDEQINEAAQRIRDRAFSQLSWDGARYQIEYELETGNGNVIWIEERGQRRHGDQKRPTDVYGVMTDITQQKKDRARQEYCAHYDQLTGLWNETRATDASRFLSALDSNRAPACLHILIANIDDILANYGYEAQDFVTARAAERLQDIITLPEFCARADDGGFIIGVVAQDGKTLVERANDIAAVLTQTSYPSPFGDMRISLAIGAIPLSDAINKPLEKARSAAAQSLKEGGGFTTWRAGIVPINQSRQKKPIEKDDIISALNDRRIVLAYQPIVDARSRQPVHYECLLRLKQKDGKLISAAEFIIAAEKLGCVSLLDRRALELASACLRDDKSIKLALNVSAATVQASESAKQYLSALRAVGAAAERIVIELTETVALEDPAKVAAFSSGAKALGCQFAIDDFGAGHTTFSNLMAIEADELKIDGGYIQDLSASAHKQAFVRMIVDLARTFGVKTVAEMVDNPEDADLLTRLGVDYLQGYYFGVPAPTPAMDRAKTAV